MQSIINTNLFKHREVATDGFNNLCTIIHHIKEEGKFYGDVFTGNHFLGRFILQCSSSSSAGQVNINLSYFDALFYTRKEHHHQNLPVYSVKPGGFIIFYATEHHNGLYVKLETTIDNYAKTVFDSRKLMADDFVSLRLIAPGDYILLNTTDKQQMKLHVRTALEKKYYHPSKVDPVQVSLTEKSFSEKEVNIQPLQVVLIRVEVNSCVLRVKHIVEEKYSTENEK